MTACGDTVWSRALPGLVRSTRKAINGLRRITAGLPGGGEAVWPGVKNDLFAAHASIYRFASSFAHGRRVLDAACGTGYGSHLLARAGATSVVGIDRNWRRLWYARRTYSHPALRFEHHDCELLPRPWRIFDLVVSSNTLEHLERPKRFLRSIEENLSPRSEMIIAVPPILSKADVREHALNPHHATSSSVRGWYELFEAHGWEVDLYCHRCRLELDFTSPHPSAASTDDFSFERGSLDSAYRDPPITAVYRLGRR